MVAKFQRHIDAILHRLADPENTAAAHRKSGMLCRSHHRYFIIVGMGRTDVREKSARCFQIRMVPDNARTLQASQLFFGKKSVRRTEGDTATSMNGTIILQQNRKFWPTQRFSSGDNPAAKRPPPREMCGDISNVSGDILYRRLHYSGRVVYRLGTVDAVLRAATALGIHDCAEINQFSAEVVLNLIRGSRQNLRMLLCKHQCIRSR